MPELLAPLHPASSRRHLPIVEGSEPDDPVLLRSFVGRLGISTILAVLFWLLILTAVAVLVPGLVVVGSRASATALAAVAVVLVTFSLAHLLALGVLTRSSGRFCRRDGVLIAVASSILCCVVANVLGPPAPLWATGLAWVLLVPSGSLGSLAGMSWFARRVAVPQGYPERMAATTLGRRP